MRTVATRSQVYKICEAIYTREGKNPSRVTVNKVLEITGGNKSRITLFVREWKEALGVGKSAPDIPKELLRELNLWFQESHNAALEEALEVKAEAQAEVEAIKAQLETNEARIAEERIAHREAIKELEHQLTIAKLESASRLADYHRSQEDLKKQASLLAKEQSKSDSLRLEVSKLQDELKEKDVAFKSEIEDLKRAHIADIQDIKEQAATMVADANERYDAETARLLNTIGNLRETIARLESTNDHLKKQNKEIADRLEATKASRDSMMQECQNLKEKLAEAQVKIDNLKGTIASMEQLEGLAGQVEELRNQLVKNGESPGVKKAGGPAIKSKVKKERQG